MENQRYAPPGAVVGDIVDASGERQAVRLWPPTGRLGRLRFFAWGVGLYVLYFIVAALIAQVVGVDSTAGAVLNGILFVAYFFFIVVLVIQRSHDMDLVGWWSILAFIPLVGLYWLFKSGSPGPNRFGPPTVPNTTATKAVAWVVGGLAVIGIVAAMAIGGIAGYQASRQGTVPAPASR